MLRSRSSLVLGMPHTRTHALSEIALLSHAAHLRWTQLAEASGTPASRHRDGEGRPVYASIYFAEIGGFPPSGMAAFGPDDEVEFVSTLGRHGRSMMDGDHRLYAPGRLTDPLPSELPAAPFVRLSNVLVAVGDGAEDLQIATPHNADVERVPQLAEEPDSYRTIKIARSEGRFFAEPPGATALWAGARSAECEVNPDRDLNGVGLLYFANFVAFMDFAERKLLADARALPAEDVDRRLTVRRRIGYYGNAQPRERLLVEVEASLLPGNRLLLHHRIRRRSDDRLIAVSSTEKHLEGATRDRPVQVRFAAAAAAAREAGS
jgi:probable biosynthetic protein (TIGR04098 family)